MTNIPQALSVGEETLALHLDVNELEFKREYRFDAKRLWRVDFAFPESQLAVEVEGGVWSGGRHVRGSGYTNDLEKYNALTLKGWRLLRFSTEMVESGEAIATIRQVLLGA